MVWSSVAAFFGTALNTHRHTEFTTHEHSFIDKYDFRFNSINLLYLIKSLKIFITGSAICEKNVLPQLLYTKDTFDFVRFKLDRFNPYDKERILAINYQYEFMY